MQRWHDLGKFKTHSVKEFKIHAQQILEFNRIQGSLASLFISEPTLGAWGNTQRDLPKHAMEALLMQVEPQSGFRLTSESDFEEMQLGGYPEIREALENDSAKMLVATMPDGMRTVAILLLKSETISSGLGGAQPGTSRQAKKPWWKFW